MVVLTPPHFPALSPMASAALGDFDVPPCDVLCNPICGPPVRAASVCQQQQGEQRVAWLARSGSEVFVVHAAVRPLFLPISATTLTPTAPGAAAAAVEGEHSTVGDATERASELLPQLTPQVTDRDRPATEPRPRQTDGQTGRRGTVACPSFLSNELRESREGVGRRDDDDDTIGARSCIRDGR